jgi:hypothetical protein
MLDHQIHEREIEVDYGVPEHWNTETPDASEMDVELLEIVDTALKEPGCTDNWCALEDTIKWKGPARYGEVLTTGGVSLPLHTKHKIQHGKRDEL